MDCRTFRKHHLAFLDDTLPGEQVAAAERHVFECAGCAAHDTAVRRSLMLARNLPPIELSPDFAARLAARLDDVRDGRYEVPTDGLPLDDWAPTRAELLRAALSDTLGSRRRMAAIAAGLLALSYAGGQAIVRAGAARDVVLPPGIATAPATKAAPPVYTPLASPALVTSASTGIPVWPAALLADQAPAHLVESQFSVASFTQ
jgi:hypothetical protein